MNIVTIYGYNIKLSDHLGAFTLKQLTIFEMPANPSKEYPRNICGFMDCAHYDAEHFGTGDEMFMIANAIEEEIELQAYAENQIEVFYGA